MNWEFSTLKPRHLKSLQAVSSKFTKKVDFVSSRNTPLTTNLNINKNNNFFELIISEQESTNKTIAAFFTIEKLDEIFLLDLIFLNKNLESTWQEIIIEKTYDFIVEKFKLNEFTLEIIGFTSLTNLPFENWWKIDENTYKIIVKPYKFIDIHSHPFAEYYDNSEKEVENCFANSIDKMVIVGTSWEDIQEVTELSKKWKNTYNIIGIHPSNIQENEDYSKLEKFINEKTIGIGEIGLDTYHKTNLELALQISAMDKQIEIAKKHNLVVMFHIRDQNINETTNLELTQDKIKKNPSINFVFHNYSAPIRLLEKFKDLPNIYFSFSGVATFKNSYDIRQAIQQLPLNKILIETDAPYLSPEPNRGLWPNSSIEIKQVYQKIAFIKGISKKDLSEIIQNNFEFVFGRKLIKN